MGAAHQGRFKDLSHKLLCVDTDDRISAEHAVHLLESVQNSAPLIPPAHPLLMVLKPVSQCPSAAGWMLIWEG